MLMHMRTTLNIDDSLLRNAAKLTGVKEKTSLVRLGLEALGPISEGPRSSFARFADGALATPHDSGRHFSLD
jgi:hypothetical protein